MPQPVVAIAVLWLVYLQVHSSMKRIRHAIECETERGPAYLMGVRFGAFCQCLAVISTGLWTIDGYRLGFLVFALLVVRAAIQIGAKTARSFGSGFEAARGSCPPALAATVGFGWVTLTRGVPLFLVFYEMGSTWR